MALMGYSKGFWALAGMAVLAFAIGCGSGDAEPDGSTTSPTGKSTAGMTGNEDIGSGSTPTAPQVAALLTKRCMPCHGGAEPQEKLNLESIEGLIKGSENGPVVVAGDAAGSKVVQAMHGTSGVDKMPPATAAQLTADEIKLVEDWINAGAKTS